MNKLENYFKRNKIRIIGILLDQEGNPDEEVIKT